LIRTLELEFGPFTLDPCPARPASEAGMPLFGTDGLHISWTGQRVFCNPPCGRHVGRWLAKARKADLAVFLLPARTDTRWWHEHALKADEIRFMRGRLRFNGAQTGAPFPSVLLVFRKKAES
jgi:site-specific DNA-methyltransferase (adenine-specific)